MYQPAEGGTSDLSSALYSRKNDVKEAKRIVT